MLIWFGYVCDLFTSKTDDLEPMPGYLSLHQEANGLIIKWTPNQLINGRTGQNSSEGTDISMNHSSLDRGYENRSL